MKSSMDCMSTSYLLKELGPEVILKLLSSRIFSINHYYIFRRSLADTPNFPVQAGGKMEMSLLCENDICGIISNLRECDVADKREVLSRLLFYRSGFNNCYVMRYDKKITYIQWIIYPAENGLIAEKYGKKFYPLSDKQVMIENAFTFQPYRGLGYLLSGTLQLLDLARAKGYRSAISYIRKDRIISLNEFSRMGFRITKIVPEYKILGKVWRAL